MGEVITFYSYKGGTGRSMALANIAYVLAWQYPARQKVLMIDWDLEAPGLHKYFYDHLKANFSVLDDRSYAAALNEAPGLIDFLSDAAEFYRSTYPSGQLATKFADTEEAVAAFGAALKAHPLSKYILTARPPDEVVSSDKAAPGLFFMKAGKQGTSTYVKQIRTFDWQKFYDQYGSLFVRLREHLADEYDFVLIDSRTGLTDIGDICTRVMPEKLVAVFVPNEQNIEGLIDIVRGAAEHRMNSRDPRALVTFPLASRIDATASRLRSIWWQGGHLDGRDIVGYERRFQDLFKAIYQLDQCDLHAFIDATQVPYDSDYAFGERIAASESTFDKLSIGYACTNAARYLVETSAPWEELPSQAQQVPVDTDPASIKQFAIFQTWRQLLVPASLGLAGIIIAILGTAWSLTSETERVSFGDVGVRTPTSVAGFGLGQATVLLIDDAAPASDPPVKVFQLDISRGKPKTATVSMRWAGLAEFTSAGLGEANLEIKRIGAVTSSAGPSPQKPPPEAKASGGDEKISRTIAYIWPTALTAAALGGALFGIALHMGRLFIAPFRRPEASLLAVFAMFDLMASLIFVLLYVIVLAPVLEIPVGYHGVLMALVAAAGATGMSSRLVVRIPKAPVGE